MASIADISLHPSKEWGPAVPAPHLYFLAAHCKIAEILHVSGIGERITQAVNKETKLLGPGSLDPAGSTDLQPILSCRFLAGI